LVAAPVKIALGAAMVLVPTDPAFVGAGVATTAKLVLAGTAAPGTVAWTPVAVAGATVAVAGATVAVAATAGGAVPGTMLTDPLVTVVRATWGTVMAVLTVLMVELVVTVPLSGWQGTVMVVWRMMVVTGPGRVVLLDGAGQSTMRPGLVGT